MDALLDESSIKFVTTRHEQGALSQRCLWPADRKGGRLPLPGLRGDQSDHRCRRRQHGPRTAGGDCRPGSTARLHKESHQILDLVSMFKPITKYSTQVLTPDIVPEIVRKAFKVAQTEKPGCCFIDFPENIAEMEVKGKPIDVQSAYNPTPPDKKIEQAAQLIGKANFRSCWPATASSGKAQPNRCAVSSTCCAFRSPAFMARA